MTFTIGDTEFELAPLPVEKSLGLLTTVAAQIGPALSSGNAADFVKIASAAPAAVSVFAAHCKVRRGQNMLALAPFVDDIFRRKPTLLIAWLSHCLREEYADFFCEAGQDRMAEAASRWEDLGGSTGGSGES